MNKGKVKYSNRLSSHEIMFPKFLHDHKEYEACEAFWHKLVKDVIGGDMKTYRTWYKNEFANGKKIMDGNPIFSLVNMEKKKAIRIIQQEPELQFSFLHGIIEDGKEANVKIKVLTLVLELSTEILQSCRTLIKDWFNDTPSEHFNQFLERTNDVHSGKERPEQDFLEETKTEASQIVQQILLKNFRNEIFHGEINFESLREHLIQMDFIHSRYFSDVHRRITRDLGGTFYGEQSLDIIQRLDDLFKKSTSKEEETWILVLYYYLLIKLTNHVYKSSKSDSDFESTMHFLDNSLLKLGTDYRDFLKKWIYESEKDNDRNIE